MAKRSYGQHCALARALDLVGERWTLLLVRELMSGPKRYKDLLAGLAGIGTNLLADRLRDLEGHGIIARADDGYALTDFGRKLEPAVLALCDFGVRFLATPRDEDLWRADWLVVALRYLFRAESARGLRGVIEYRIDDVVVQARVARGRLETTLGTPWKPDAVLTTDGDSLLALGRGELDLDSPTLGIEGDRELLDRSLEFFTPEVG